MTVFRMRFSIDFIVVCVLIKRRRSKISENLISQIFPKKYFPNAIMLPQLFAYILVGDNVCVYVCEIGILIRK